MPREECWFSACEREPVGKLQHEDSDRVVDACATCADIGTSMGWEDFERYDVATDGGQEDADLQIVVEFSERFTVTPPENVDDPVYAKDWFWNIYSDIGWDVLDPKKKDHYEIVDVRTAEQSTEADIDV